MRTTPQTIDLADMARREDIETSIWSDPDFLALPGPARAVYIWAFTNVRCPMAGIYKVPRQAIALETGFDGEQLASALAELERERFLFYDGRVLFVRTRVKRLRTKSQTIAKAIRGDLDVVAGHPFVRLWWQENRTQDWLLPIVVKPENVDDSDGSSRGYRDPIDGVQGTGTGKGLGIRGIGGVGGRGTRRVDQSRPPAGFPADLLARLPAVLALLRGAHELRGGLEPRERGAGLAMLRNPKADHEQVARKLVHWLTAGPGQHARCRDIAARFGDWVANEGDAQRWANANGLRRETASDWLQDDFVDGEPIVEATAVEEVSP